jgi:hypothetical protein
MHSVKQWPSRVTNEATDSKFSCLHSTCGLLRPHMVQAKRESWAQQLSLHLC